MKIWRYFYLIAWLVIASFFLNLFPVFDRLPEPVWNFLRYFYGNRDGESAMDFTNFLTYAMSFLVMTVVTFPLFILCTKKYPHREVTGWSTHPVARIVRIFCVTTLSFIVVLYLYAIVESVVFSQKTLAKLGNYIDIPAWIFICGCAVLIGNSYRKMSKKCKDGVTR